MSSGFSDPSWVRGNCIGKGSFGEVSLALERSSGRTFAVKSVDCNSSPVHSVLALENEIRILRILRSPYVVSYLGDDFTKETPSALYRNLHVEHVSGGSLAELAARRGGLGEREVRGYARCVVRALRYLHGEAGVVHGDVKGRNVLVGDGIAKIADFGSARRVGSDSDSDSDTICGTPLWMAPEVVRGGRPTPASDVWSLGCTVIEAVTGAKPWADSSNGVDVLVRIGYGNDSPQPPHSASKLCRDFVDKCLRRDPSERWSCEQLLQHPFLAEASADFNQTEADYSPRGVLDWAWAEVGAGDSSGGFDSDETAAVACARERVRELDSGEGPVDWDSDGWEVVRSAAEGNLVKRTAGEEGGLPIEFPNFRRGDLQNWEGNGDSLSSSGEEDYCMSSGLWIGLGSLEFGFCDTIELFFSLMLLGFNSDCKRDYAPRNLQL
ncbi:mitogen-activated protein kinase kinase kinase 18-like [Typha latifolia]|uniref:mitogen-activated protein kinase kinase kinase 18-like n=1 Tax=Typha latifolia TaxID=4733 RepID=UPI003C2C331A